MAKPAFIYAFDNLGPARFAEFCGLLLASRHTGFLLGGVGPDGGIDGEIDEFFGEWRPESASALLNEVIQPKYLVVFQFKHQVTARVGQKRSRDQLLKLYKCTPTEKCELHRRLVKDRMPNVYVLVTNVEVNSNFRAKFIHQCRNEEPSIKHYQIIGLDELEGWVTMEGELRHIYFPTIFGPPRFSLHVKLSSNFYAPHYGGLNLDLDEKIEILTVAILNVGTVPSYVQTINFRVIVDGELKSMFLFRTKKDEIMDQLNPVPGTPIEPGRRQDYVFRFDELGQMGIYGTKVFPTEVVVFDEIENQYSATIPENVRNKILEYMPTKVD
jgi:hypothetical protein